MFSLRLRVAAAALAAARLARGAAARPNFLVVLVDDADAQLGSTGAAAMPHLASLVVDKGANFSAAHVVSPICCPSRTALFSGRYPHNLGDDSLGWCGNFSASREDSLLVALGNAGYAVGQAGKWYNLESEAGGFCTPGYVPAWKDDSPRGRASDAFLLCQEGVYYGNPYNANGEIVTRGHAPEDYMTAVIGNRSLAFLRNVTAGGAPWVNFVAFQAPHLPATPAPWHADAPVPAAAPRTPAWNAGWEDKHFVVNNGLDKPMSAGLVNGSDTLHAQRLRTLLSVDDYVRDAVALLDAAGALDNTYVFFTSDQGVRRRAGGGAPRTPSRCRARAAAPAPRGGSPSPPSREPLTSRARPPHPPHTPSRAQRLPPGPVGPVVRKGHAVLARHARAALRARPGRRARRRAGRARGHERGPRPHAAGTRGRARRLAVWPRAPRRRVARAAAGRAARRAAAAGLARQNAD